MTAVLLGCGPDPEPEPCEPAPRFVQVEAVLGQNCVLFGCHGEPAEAWEPGDDLVETLTTTTAASGRQLVEPGEPDESELYFRITRPLGDPQLMGQGAYGAIAMPLPADDIAVIEAWIGDGAPECVP